MPSLFEDITNHYMRTSHTPLHTYAHAHNAHHTYVHHTHSTHRMERSWWRRWKVLFCSRWKEKEGRLGNGWLTWRVGKDLSQSLQVHNGIACSHPSPSPFSSPNTISLVTSRCKRNCKCMIPKLYGRGGATGLINSKIWNTTFSRLHGNLPWV